MDTSTRKRNRTEGFEEDALREVLAIERRVQGILKDAEAEAHRIVAAAKQQAQERRAAAEAEAREQAQAALQAARTTTEQQVGEIQAQAERDADTWEHNALARFDEAVDYVIQIIVLKEA